MATSRSCSIGFSANGCAAASRFTNQSRGTLSYRPTRPGSRIEAGRSTSPATTWSGRQSGREGKAWVSAILFGSEPEFAGGEPGQIEKTIVASEGLRPEDFIIPEIPRISSKGTRREILAPFRGLDVQVGEAAFSLSFELTRGSYATCLVREFTKSE